MNISSNETLVNRPRRLSLSIKPKNTIAIPAFSNLPDPQVSATNRNKRSSIGGLQSKAIKLTKSSRTIQQSSHNLVSVKDIQKTVSCLTLKDILKANNQKSNAKLTNYEIRIRVISNYGHENLITSGEIDVLDHNQATIRNITCNISTSNTNNVEENSTQVPDEIIKGERYNATNTQVSNDDDTAWRLVNQSIIKNSLEETWIHNWKPQHGENKEFEKDGFDIILSFKSQIKPHYVRIFPSPFITEANIKDLRIYVNKEFIYEGTINETFCSVIELNYEGENTTNLAVYIKTDVKNMPRILRDPFGILPFCLTKEISISIIECYNQKSYINLTSNLINETNSNDPFRNAILFGIRKITFFTTNGQMVKSDMMDFNTKNIKCFSQLPALFTDDHTTANSPPWKGAYLDDNEFIISFINPLPIAAIGFLSPSIHTTFVDIRVKKLAVKANGVMKWVGKIVNQNPSQNQNNKDGFPFFVYLTNHKEAKEKIPKYFS